MSTPVNNPVRPAIEAFFDDNAGGTFPSNIIQILHMRFDLLGYGLNLVDRMPRNDDKNYTIGFVPIVSTPQPSSYEIHGPNGFTGATIREYLIVIYAFVRDALGERGQANHGILTEIVEVILESDPALRASLAMLQSEVLGSVKRFSKHYIRQSRYIAHELNGDHLFLQATEVVFEVEKVS